MKALARIEDAALIGALASMLILALLQILLRNFFDTALLWIDPLVRSLVLWVAVLGAMVATRENHHINIDVVSRYLPASAERITAIVASLAASAICLTIAWTAIEFIRYEYEDGTTAFGVVPNWIVQAIIPFGFAIMGWRFIVRALQRAMGES